MPRRLSWPNSPRMSGDLILHIGAPKCGSSSLQSALSRTPNFQGRAGESYCYACLKPTGGLLQGKALTRRAMASPYMYAASPNVHTEVLAQANLARNADAIAALRATGKTVILSSEGWITRTSQFEATDFIRKAGGNAHVVVYLRPSLDWLNSAWWQWGVWGKRDVARFSTVNTSAVRWPARLQAWEQSPGVSRLTVRLASSDTVANFYELLNADVPQMKNANSGVPPAFLHFLLRNRAYRPNAHDASTEFVVGRNIAAQRVPAPWAIPESVAVDTAKKLRNVPKKLMPFLETPERKLVEDDPRWWSADAYSGRQIDQPEDYLTPESLSGLLLQLTSELKPRQTRHIPDALADIAHSAPSERVAVADKYIRQSVDALKRRDHRTRIVKGLLSRGF